ncbi:MAG: hypothetical protein C5B54_05915 [Acidobacteria bacterium]|nr:MAG: hypothetical protein C5B54_05915 [Acidobacteriota bacterium]
MNQKFVSGLILAAGASSRLGQPKQLLPYRGTTLLEWAVRKYESCSALDEVVVVLGANADDVRQRVNFGKSKTVVNAATAQGCSASYRVGIGACNPDVEALVVLLSDQPGVETDTVQKVVAGWREEGSKIVLASYRGRRGHPMLFSHELFDSMLTLHGDKAVWKLVDQHPEWVREIFIDSDLPKDINTWDDYKALKNTPS